MSCVCGWHNSLLINKILTGGVTGRGDTTVRVKWEILTNLMRNY